MSHFENRLAFEDTLQRCRKDAALAQALHISLATQRIFLEEEELPTFPSPRFIAPARVIVSPKRTFEAAAAYKGQTVAVLNFASSTTPGGGVVNGAHSQEEALCRCSTLYPALKTEECWNRYYLPHRTNYSPLNRDDCILTSGVVVFKSDVTEPIQLLPPREWQTLSVVTCAAPHLEHDTLGENFGEKTIPAYALQAVLERRWRRILTVMRYAQVDIAILGAFGCGAFHNPPELVATAAARVLPEFRYDFRCVEFAVFCMPGHETKNYEAFQRILG